MLVWDKLEGYDTLNVFTYLGNFWCDPEELTTTELYKADMIFGFKNGLPYILKNRFERHS